MSIRNSPESYGSVSRTLHWLTALLIIGMIPLGLIANNAPFTNDAELNYKFLLFTLHKTLGLTLFGVALIRILWTISQPKPGPLHPNRRAETFLADTVHWLLYASLVLLPITGWTEHAAMPGLAPIWWPFGQTLPFIPTSFWLAETAGAFHVIFGKVLIGAILLHVAGALKHHLIDRDGTLRRMWSGQATPGTILVKRDKAAIIAALALYLIAIGIGVAVGTFPA
jgi:cytochrome b561